ncbi:Retrovirus-related Pol polyprotein from transposon 17.6 [Labeo rohita]|uniref:ribonuclease H n=1 Tax=Labeo rohita TaxID=84645 RepID=A0ABQ8LMF9_LABRO|nr:Retrovirus-related Pol polyprotein from transposon 17.6 [Labeo rohita]
MRLNLIQLSPEVHAVQQQAPEMKGFHWLLGIISPVEEDTTCVSAISATVKKDGLQHFLSKIRILADFSGQGIIETHNFYDIVQKPCEIVMDDILIWGSSVEEHNKCLKCVQDHVTAINMQLNPTKCCFRVAEVPYVGHLLTGRGVKPDPEKTKAIHQKSKCANAEWHWTEQHAAAVDTLKGHLTSSPVLQYFDVHKPVTVFRMAGLLHSHRDLSLTLKRAMHRLRKNSWD